MANGKTITINSELYVTDGACPVKSVTTGLIWNEEIRLGTKTSVSVTFPTPPSDISCIASVIFTAGSSSTSVTFTPPSGYTIKGLESISYTSGKTYEISFRVINGSTISALYAETE